jgi:hypothetical protein
MQRRRDNQQCKPPPRAGIFSLQGRQRSLSVYCVVLIMGSHWPGSVSVTAAVRCAGVWPRVDRPKQYGVRIRARAAHP